MARLHFAPETRGEDSFCARLGPVGLLKLPSCDVNQRLVIQKGRQVDQPPGGRGYLEAMTSLLQRSNLFCGPSKLSLKGYF